MWKKLTPSEQAVVLGKALVSVGLVALAIALGYFAYQIGAARQELPTLLAQVEATSQKVEPVLREVDAIRDLVPPILKEAKAMREVVASTVSEATALRKALPPLVDASASAINNASRAVRAIEPHIPSVLTEVKKTREALPDILDRADQVAGRAEKMGQAASRGVVTGLLGGIIIAPFRLIGDVGRGLSDIIGLGSQSGFTIEDDRLASAATDAVLKAGAPGAQQAWQNPENGNQGSVAWLTKKLRDNQMCVTLRYRVEFKTGKTHDVKVELCQQSDGSWVKPKM